MTSKSDHFLGALTICGGFALYICAFSLSLDGATRIWLHLIGGFLVAAGATFLTSGQGGRGTRFWVFVLFCMGIPIVGAALTLGLALTLYLLRGSKGHEEVEVMVGIPSRPLGDLPDPATLLKLPLLSTQHLMASHEIEGIALGVADVDTPEATRLLHHLGRSPEVGVELFARGAVRQRLESMESELKALELDADSLWNQRGIAEICLRGISSEIVPEEERELYAKRGLVAADGYLEVESDEVEMLHLRAELMLAMGDLSGASATVESLGRRAEGRAAALAVGARTIFETVGSSAATELKVQS